MDFTRQPSFHTIVGKPNLILKKIVAPASIIKSIELSVPKNENEPKFPVIDSTEVVLIPITHKIFSPAVNQSLYSFATELEIQNRKNPYSIKVSSATPKIAVSKSVPNTENLLTDGNTINYKLSPSKPLTVKSKVSATHISSKLKILKPKRSITELKEIAREKARVEEARQRAIASMYDFTKMNTLSESREAVQYENNMIDQRVESNDRKKITILDDVQLCSLQKNMFSVQSDLATDIIETPTLNNASCSFVTQDYANLYGSEETGSTTKKATQKSIRKIKGSRIVGSRISYNVATKKLSGKSKVRKPTKTFSKLNKSPKRPFCEIEKAITELNHSDAFDYRNSQADQYMENNEFTAQSLSEEYRLRGNVLPVKTKFATVVDEQHMLTLNEPSCSFTAQDHASITLSSSPERYRQLNKITVNFSKPKVTKINSSTDIVDEALSTVPIQIPLSLESTDAEDERDEMLKKMQRLEALQMASAKQTSEVMVVVKQMNKRLDRFSKYADDDNDEIGNYLPTDTLQQLNSFDQVVTDDPQFKKKLRLYLRGYKGSSTPKNFTSVLRKVMTDKLINDFNLNGSSGKMALMNYKFLDIIHGKMIILLNLMKYHVNFESDDIFIV